MKNGRKRYPLSLTWKQIDAITTALHEWAEIEDGSRTGAKIRKHSLATLDTINRQVARIDHKRNQKL